MIFFGNAMYTMCVYYINLMLNFVNFLMSSQWSEEACAAHLTQRDGYQATTQGQLKDQLYQGIINYFDKGKVTNCQWLTSALLFLLIKIKGSVKTFQLFG